MKKLFIIYSTLLINSSFCQTTPLSPSATMALLKGVFTNFSNKPLPHETVILYNTKAKKEFRVVTDTKGNFEILVPNAASYELKYKNFTTEMNYTKMDIPAKPDATYKVQIKVEPPKEFVIDNVFFDTGKSTLKPQSNKSLNDLVDVLKLKNTMVIELQGHTDNVGKPEDNLKLSQARAEAVKSYLVSKGIDATRISAKGYGDTQPVDDNSTVEGKAKNRRTSLKVLKE